MFSRRKKIVLEKPQLFWFDNKPTLIGIMTLCDPLPFQVARHKRSRKYLKYTHIYIITSQMGK